MKKTMALKKYRSSFLAFIVFLFIIFLGFLLGKYISNEYNKKNNTALGVFEIIKIEIFEKPVNFVLTDGPQTISDLCGKDTGICDMSVGTVELDRVKLQLYIYANFDNPNETPSTYFKLGERKIGSFVYLDTFEILDNKYLIVTEPNSIDNNYLIHIYNNKGIELMNYDATNEKAKYEISGKNLYFYYCDPIDRMIDDLGETTYGFKRYRVTSDDVQKKTTISTDYRKCV